MKRFSLVAVSALSIGVATVALQSCGAKSVEAAATSGPINGLLTLPDGSTFVAAEGSLPREIAEWLASREGDEARFAFSGFDEDRPRLSRSGLGSAADLATILRAAPATSLEIAGDKAQAKALAAFLDDRGIGSERLKIVPAAGLGSVMLTVHRGSTAPLMSAGS